MIEEITDSNRRIVFALHSNNEISLGAVAMAVVKCISKGLVVDLTNCVCLICARTKAESPGTIRV